MKFSFYCALVAVASAARLHQSLSLLGEPEVQGPIAEKPHQYNRVCDNTAKVNAAGCAV